MPTDESRASTQRSSTRPRRWFSRRAGPRHQHRQGCFLGELNLVIDIVEGFLGKLKLVIDIVMFFCLLDQQPWWIVYGVW